MRKLFLICTGVIAIGLSACGGVNTPQAKKAEVIIKQCLPKGNLSTPAGRKRVLQCIAPPGHTAAFERCAIKYLTVGNITIHRVRLYEGVATCLENNR